MEKDSSQPDDPLEELFSQMGLTPASLGLQEFDSTMMPPSSGNHPTSAASNSSKNDTKPGDHTDEPSVLQSDITRPFEKSRPEELVVNHSTEKDGKGTGEEACCVKTYEQNSSEHSSLLSEQQVVYDISTPDTVVENDEIEQDVLSETNNYADPVNYFTTNRANPSSIDGRDINLGDILPVKFDTSLGSLRGPAGIRMMVREETVDESESEDESEEIEEAPLVPSMLPEVLVVSELSPEDRPAAAEESPSQRARPGPEILESASDEDESEVEVPVRRLVTRRRSQEDAPDADVDGEPSDEEEEEVEEVLEQELPVERPLVLRRQTSFQRELADAIVRLAPLEELELLLRCGAKVSEAVTQGLTPLHYAVWQRYPEAAELLIREGCDLNARDDIGYTPLHLCAEHGYLDMMQVLLRHNARVNVNHPQDEDLYPIDAVDEPLRLALKHDQIEAARVLLEHNADPNGRYFFGSEINLVSPLKTELLELLLSWGARPNTRDRYGFTPIMKACHVQQEAEEALEERGSISGRDVLLHFTQTLKGIESVLVLLSHGADINLRTDARHEYRSVLHYAILSGSSPIVNLLIKQGAKVNLEPEYNRASPLHLAVLKGDINIINMLLDADACINITTPTVGSPLHVACSEQIPNRLEVLKILLDRGADPNIVVRHESGRPLKPPLGEYLANSIDHDVEVVKLMLRHGAQVVMQTPQQCPLGLLNCLYPVAKNREVMVELLEAAEKFDVALIRRTPLLVPSCHRDLVLDVAANPLSLRHMARVLVRQLMTNRRPDAIYGLALPKLLQQYLLYEIS